MKKAVVMTAVKYPDGPGSIKKIFDEYKSVLGLQTVSNYSVVWNTLAEKGDFADITELLNEYNRLVKSATAPGGGSGGGSSGGGGGGGNSSTGSTGKNITSDGGIPTPSMNVVSEQTAKETIEMKFEDLNSVPWAYKSISRMYDAGIINGVSKTEFRPDFSVMREEFVKMTVVALGFDADSESSVFTDVEKGAWYEGYIVCAVKNGIVNGIGEGVFGVGQEIKRQDMAVLIYNAMKKSGKFVPCNADLSFSDAEQIADYAKTAVAELSKLGIITGVGEDTFDPNGIATRAQAAVIIDRALEYLR